MTATPNGWDALRDARRRLHLFWNGIDAMRDGPDDSDEANAQADIAEAFRGCCRFVAEIDKLLAQAEAQPQPDPEACGAPVRIVTGGTCANKKPCSLHTPFVEESCYVRCKQPDNCVAMSSHTTAGYTSDCMLCGWKQNLPVANWPTRTTGEKP